MNFNLSFGGSRMKNELKSKASNQNKDAIYQVSLLQGLAYGDYYGSVALEELKRHGDTGIGTFDRLNGELIMLDGVVYRASGDGSIEVASDDETTPFAVVTFLNGDETKSLKAIPDYGALTKTLDEMVAARGKNRFYMIRLDGVFRKMSVRSVYAQEEPYKPLVEVLRSQSLFDYENVEGTVVGLYCPPYMSHLNAVGWHMHFICADKTRGGHVLGLDIAHAVLTWDDIDAFELRLPRNAVFGGFDLTVDQSEDIEKIEKSR